MNSELTDKNTEISELTLEDFARLFGTTIDDIPDDCRELIAKTDFRYKKLISDKRKKIILRILKTIDSDSLSVVGAHRMPAWEKGWSENLQNFVDSNFDLNELIPKFVKRNEVIRLNSNYVLPTNKNFETCFVEVLRTYIFRKYFSDAPAVYEFGCGTGLNLVNLAKLFQEKKLYGLDWSTASRDIVNKIAITQKMNLTGILFDMYSPDYQLDIDKGSAVFTIGAMEQLGKNFESFLQFLLEKRPSICINIETIHELYDQSVLFDYVAAKYLERRGYLQGYLTRLRQLEVEGKVEMIKIQRTFGSLYHDGYSYIVWKSKA
ncbi:class I SAM-dependent methyltransferase [Candidatus Woesearchaeota archaeon]|nr:class I SAM-dependent methyltransferase [Candidatus Woesearchaeota archaeon]